MARTCSRVNLRERTKTRLQDGIEKGFRIALMCAEKEPLECHRTILVSRHLAALGIEIQQEASMDPFDRGSGVHLGL